MTWPLIKQTRMVLIMLKTLLTRIRSIFMLDTEAAVCLLDTSVWQEIKGEAVLSPWVRSGLVGVAGTLFQVCGTTKLKVEFGGTGALHGCNCG